MPLITPTGKANNALPVIRQKVPTMAGRIPPDVMPSVGAPVKNSHAMDMLLAAGEEISISLLTMALQELGVSAISLTGWQAGFNTDRAYSKARIKRLDTERVESELARNRVVVVAGFQLSLIHI